MISVENLYSLKRCYFHSGCPDGIAAREIIKNAFPNVEQFVPFHFGTVLDLEKVDLSDTIFVDCHPVLEQCGEIFERFQNVCIADHHKTSEPIFNELDLAGYGDQLFRPDDNETSGAMLAWKLGAVSGSGSHEAWEFAKLISISDTWQTKHPEFEKSRRLAQFIQIFGDSWEGFPTESVMDMLRFNGPYHMALMKKNDALSEHAIIRYVNGFKVAFIGGDRISDAAEILRSKHGVDVIVGYKILNLPGKGDVISYSTRSNPERFNVRVMAEVYGGGGHNAAAGFSVRYDDTDPIQRWITLYKECNNGIDQASS